MNYNSDQLCEIYYLYHVYDSECIKDIENKYPELLKYNDALRSICFRLEIFRGEYPEFYEQRYHFSHFPFSVIHHNTSVYCMSEVLKMISRISEDKLSLIDSPLLSGVSMAYRHRYTDKLKAVLTPTEAAEEDLYEYISNIELMLSDETCGYPFNEIKYNDLYLIPKKQLEFYRYAEEHFKNTTRPHIFVDMIIAYFYAHLEKYDYNYDNLSLLIQKFQENAFDYINEYDSTHEKRYDLLGGLIVNDMEVYHFVESIIDRLLDDKSIIRRKK